MAPFEWSITIPGPASSSMLNSPNSRPRRRSSGRLASSRSSRSALQFLPGGRRRCRRCAGAWAGARPAVEPGGGSELEGLDEPGRQGCRAPGGDQLISPVIRDSPAPGESPPGVPPARLRLRSGNSGSPAPGSCRPAGRANPGPSTRPYRFLFRPVFRGKGLGHRRS